MWKDCETNIDYLDFEYLTKVLIDIVNNDKLSPSSIGLYGNWGCGKSSLMEICINELSKNENILCIKFNGWLFESYENAKTALLGTILDKIQEKKTLSASALGVITNLYHNVDKLELASKGLKHGVDFLLTGGLGTIADLTLTSLIPKIKDKAGLIESKDIQEMLKENLENKKVRESLQNFQKNFSELLKETNITKLVVFIDELDRCNTNTILETLEAIRLFIFTNNTSFIIGADERHVTYAVRSKFKNIEGNQLDIGKEYLEKMIQYPIRIPQLSRKDVELYIMCLLFENELNNEEFNKVLSFINEEKKKNFIEFEFTFESLNLSLPLLANKLKDVISLSKQISSVLATGLNGNPRHCKRFLNSLFMRENMAKHKQAKIDRKILAKLMLLEYFKMDFFKKLAKLQSENNGKPLELTLIEENKWNEVEEFKLWKEDLWLLDWIKVEPILSNIDLRPYFYFSRESLASQLNLSEYSLSPISKEILDLLFGGSDIQIKNALKLSSDVNNSEANIILENLINKITTDSEDKIPISLLKSLLAWGESNNLLYTGVINCLKEISGSKVTFAIMPRLKGFMDKTSKNAEIIEILRKWKEENNNLTSSINKNFEGI